MVQDAGHSEIQPCKDEFEEESQDEEARTDPRFDRTSAGPHFR